jgi:hypothetical protein
MPTHDGIGHAVGRGEIRLYVEQRGAVETIETDDAQSMFVDS